TVQVDEDREPPIVDAGEAGQLDCVDQSLRLSGTVSPIGETAFEWSTLDGNLVDDLNSLQPIVDEVGTYVLQAVNLNNGCTASDVVQVEYDPEVPQGVELDITEPSCFGEEDGQISILDAIGGTPPILYSLDGENFFDNKDYIRLGAGDYRLYVQDAKGCEWDTLITLAQPAPFVVSMGGPLIIQLGDSIRLSPQVNLPLDSFYWDEDPTLSCTDCWNPIASPTTTNRYRLFLQSDRCMELAQVEVQVIKERKVYIPTAFSPNGDGWNEKFTIYAGTGVSRIKNFRIYDRWGALVFEQLNAQPNADNEGWDGRLKGELLRPGVFVYYAEIEFTDGLVELYKGDVTLMR
ncbi:MAG: gliding motility-associated C-terminal domain-containing protein, partial [Bacteroidota bacterium]